MSKWDELSQRVERNGDILSMTMRELRDMAENDRLGSNVVKDIALSLTKMALGHIPQVLPRQQNDLVRLYKRGTPIGTIIDSILTPSEEKDGEILQSIKLGDENEQNMVEAINQIKDIVSDF